MAIKLKRVSAAAGTDELPELPVADLLPPSQALATQVRRATRIAAGLAVGFLVVNAAVAGFILLAGKGVEAELAGERTTTQQMQQTLKQHSEALAATAAIDQLTQDRVAVTAREGDWDDLLDSVTDATPDGMSITVFNLQTVGSSSSGSSSSTTDASATNIGTVKVTAESDDLPNISQWIDNVSEIDGVSDVTAQQIDNQDQSSEDEGAAQSYQSQLTLTLSSERFINRFVTQDATSDEGDN